MRNAHTHTSIIPYTAHFVHKHGEKSFKKFLHEKTGAVKKQTAKRPHCPVPYENKRAMSHNPASI